MGKKKIIKQTEAELLKETEAVEGAFKRTAEVSAARRVDRGRIYIAASYNNTMISATDEKGNVIAWASAGALGFKGPKKATPFAAARVAEAITEKIKKAGFSEVEIYVRGIGAGRESAIRTFIAKGMDVKLIKDVTPIPHNGPRPPKVRRV